MPPFPLWACDQCVSSEQPPIYMLPMTGLDAGRLEELVEILLDGVLREAVADGQNAQFAVFERVRRPGFGVRIGIGIGIGFSPEPPCSVWSSSADDSVQAPITRAPIRVA